jgi:CubicO group peptidase (beta-lactamase class C family)
MRRYIDNELLAGTVTLIARDGKIIHLKAQGWKDKENDLAMTDDTLFVIMSMTKPIVSVALMMLYEEGRFLLTDPVSKWIPEIIDKKVIIQTDGKTIREETASPITFRDVLAHTAGVNPPRDALNTEEINLLDRKDTLEETILARAPLPLAFHPGEEWQYGSSTDYVALLVERIADQSLTRLSRAENIQSTQNGRYSLRSAPRKGKASSLCLQPFRPRQKNRTVQSPSI